MPLIDDKGDLVQIELPAEGEWVRVKARLSRGDEVAIRKAVVQGGHMTPGAALEMDPASALDAAEFAALEVAIKQWSFEAPVTAFNIRRLDGDSIDAIKERLNELYPSARSDDERGNSSGNGAGTPEDSRALLPLSTGS